MAEIQTVRVRHRASGKTVIINAQDFTSDYQHLSDEAAAAPEPEPAPAAAVGNDLDPYTQEPVKPPRRDRKGP